VPAKLSARVRVFATGQGRKTDPVDAHSVAVVGLRTADLRHIQIDGAIVALGLLVDHRDELGRARSQTVNRLHRLLLELLPGGVKKFLSATQARALLVSVRPRDVVGKTRRRLAAGLIIELALIDKRIKAANVELRDLITASGSSLLELSGIGPSSAARLLGDVSEIGRFADKGRFASWNGTAPLDASSGDQRRHRLSRAGNRRINRVLHIMAVVGVAQATPTAAPITEGNWPLAKPRWKPCAASNGVSPTSSIGRWSTTRNAWRRVREDTRGRLQNPARPTSTPRSVLRTSHRTHHHRPPTPVAAIQPIRPSSPPFPTPSINADPQLLRQAQFCLSAARTRRTLIKCGNEQQPLDTEGSHERAVRGMSDSFDPTARPECGFATDLHHALDLDDEITNTRHPSEVHWPTLRDPSGHWSQVTYGAG
jgi:hypothetical protein